MQGKLHLHRPCLELHYLSAISLDHAWRFYIAYWLHLQALYSAQKATARIFIVRRNHNACHTLTHTIMCSIGSCMLVGIDSNSTVPLCPIQLFFSYDGMTFVSLTCAVNSISIKASRTGTLKATEGVTASSIHMAVVQPISTLINIYKKQTDMPIWSSLWHIQYTGLFFVQ